MQQFSPSGFGGLGTVVKNIIIVNVVMFIACIILGKSGIDVCDFLGLHSWQELDANGNHAFKPYQLVTHAFCHGGNYVGPTADLEGAFMHMLMNMFGLWMFGNTLESIWGSKRFFNFYMLCAIAAGLAQIGYYYYLSSSTGVAYYGVAVGASGAIFGILAAFAYLFPNSTLYLYFFIPIKTWIAILLYATYEFMKGMSNAEGDNVAHFAHLGGMAAGFIIVFIWNKTNKRKFY